MKIWMVRSGQGGYLVDEFVENGIVAIGWNFLGEIPSGINYDNLKKLFSERYPQDSAGRINQSVGQIWRFYKDFQIGDKVVTYDSTTREYYLGEIVSSYEYDESYEYFHTRRVKWEKIPVQRDLLSYEAKNSLGSILTIFEIQWSIWNELQKSNLTEEIDGDEIKDLEQLEQRLEEQKRESIKQEQLEEIKQDVFNKSKEFIKDKISKLTWQDTEVLVGGILRALGYKTRFTSKGSDLGSDIVASRDALALEQPIIKIEVKKRTNDKIGADEIRTFIGGLRNHHTAIYVTTTGFTKEARYEQERANLALTLIDSDWLVQLIIDNYELFEPEIKALIPLKKIYWPA